MAPRIEKNTFDEKNYETTEKLHFSVEALSCVAMPFMSCQIKSKLNQAWKNVHLDDGISWIT